MSEYKFKTGDIVVTNRGNIVKKATVLECKKTDFSCVVLESEYAIADGMFGEGKIVRIGCDDYEKIEEQVEEKEEKPVCKFKKGDILVTRKSAITTASKLVYLEPFNEDYFIAAVLESKLEHVLKIGEIYDRFYYAHYRKEEEEKKAEEQEDIFKPGKVVVSHNGRDVVMVIDRESTDFDETFCGVKLSNARYGSDEYKRGHLDRRWDKSKFKLYEGTIKVHG